MIWDEVLAKLHVGPLRYFLGNHRYTLFELAITDVFSADQLLYAGREPQIWHIHSYTS